MACPRVTFSSFLPGLWPLLLLTLLAAPASALADETEAELPVATAVEQLASDDSRERDAARRRLLQAEFEELDEIAEAAAAIDPERRALPELRQCLQEAVRQVMRRRAKQEFTASDEATFRQDLPLGFFGIQLAGREMTAQLMGNAVGPGIVVARCLPGFRAYEHFEEGDVVLAARVEREGEFHNVFDLRYLNNLLREVDPRRLMDFQKSVVMEVVTLRAGQVVVVPFRLDVRIETDATAFTRAQQRASEAAEALWASEFSPLFSERAAASPGSGPS